MSEHETNHFFRGGMLTVALIAVAGIIFSHVYRPAQTARQALEEELRIAAGRQETKKERLRAMREKCAELENGDPETLAEVIRQELGKGATDEYFK